MPLDKNLLNTVLMGKQAYAPPGPMPGQPGMDPTMMDPTMMAAGGQAPPAPPMPMGGGAPMDPMAMAGGMPPVPGMPDPAMAGGAPPMDPSMVGGLPPQGDPMAGGMPPEAGAEDPMGGGMPIMLNSDDLMALFQQIGGAQEDEDEKPSGRVTNRELAEQVDELSTMVGQLMSHFNLKPAGEIPGMGAEELPMEEAGMPPLDMGMPAEGGMPALPPEVMAAMGEAPGGEGGGMPPPEMMDMGTVPMEMGPEKMASDNKDQLAHILSQMNELR